MEAVLMIDSDDNSYHQLKTLLEFIECEKVISASQQNWREQLADSTISAAFVADRLGSKLNSVISGLHEKDNALPIILMTSPGNEILLSGENQGYILKTLEFPFTYQDLTNALLTTPRAVWRTVLCHRTGSVRKSVCPSVTQAFA